MGETDNNQWKRWRLIKTCCLVASWLSAGMYASMLGPSIIDLTEVANCNYEELAYALTAKNVALTLAALASGYFCSRYQRHLEGILSVSLILLGISTAAVPWCSLLPLMAVAMMFQGLTHGILGVAGNSWVALLWEGSSSGPLHALHFGNAFGGVLAPLIIRPFLSSDTNGTGAHSNSSSNHTLPHTPTRIQIPYGGYGIYTLIWGGVFLYFYVKDRRSPNGNGLYQTSSTRIARRSEDGRTFAGVRKSFGIFIAVLFFVFYTFIAGLYQTIPTYLMPMSVNGKLHLTKSEGNLLVFGYTLNLVCGRLFATFLSKCLSIHIMFMFEIAISCVIALAMVFYSFQSVTIWWVLICSYGFFTSPIFPSGIAWSEVYLEIAGPLMAVFFAGGGCGTLLFQWLGGYGIQNISEIFPIYANAVCAGCVLLLYCVAAIACRLYGKRTQHHYTEKLDDDTKCVPDETQPLIN